MLVLSLLFDPRKDDYSSIAVTMSTANPAPNVGGTAKDGGLSTAATVADGGPSDQQPDNTSQYLPPGVQSSEKP